MHPPPRMIVIYRGLNYPVEVPCLSSLDPSFIPTEPRLGRNAETCISHSRVSRPNHYDHPKPKPKPVSKPCRQAGIVADHAEGFGVSSDTEGGRRGDRLANDPVARPRKNFKADCSPTTLRVSDTASLRRTPNRQTGPDRRSRTDRLWRDQWVGPYIPARPRHRMMGY